MRYRKIIQIRSLAMALLLAWALQPHAEEAKPKFRLVKDTGWRICHAVLKRLESLPPPDDKVGCETPLDPKSKLFGTPEWEELKIEEHWETIYAMESFLSGTSRGGQRLWKECIGCEGIPVSESAMIPPPEAWRGFYEANMRSGIIKPRLRRTKVRLSSDGPEDILLAYTPERRDIERCKQRMAHGERVYTAGEHLFPLDPESGQLTYIYPAEGWASSQHSLLFMYDRVAYAAHPFPSARQVVLNLSRMYRGHKLEPARDLHYYDQTICEIVDTRSSDAAR